MTAVSATKFVRNFTAYRDQANRDGVVEIESHGRVIGAFISAAELETYRDLKGQMPENVKPEDLDEEWMDAIDNAEHGKLPD